MNTSTQNNISYKKTPKHNTFHELHTNQISDTSINENHTVLQASVIQWRNGNCPWSGLLFTASAIASSTNRRGCVQP